MSLYYYADPVGPVKQEDRGKTIRMAELKAMNQPQVCGA
jgi:hypothetical protein